METTATVKIKLDTEAARIYREATKEDKQKMQLLLSIWLREFGKPPQSLRSLMDEISNKAKVRGLTSDILDSLLNGE